MEHLVFRTYKKTESSLDWSLLKITFKDMQLLKQISDYNTEMIGKQFKQWKAQRNESYDS